MIRCDQLQRARSRARAVILASRRNRAIDSALLGRDVVAVPTMTRVCSWHPSGQSNVIGTVPCSPEQAGTITHGCCDECARKLEEAV